MKKQLTVGLFGTCGKSVWRKPFIEQYELKNISYFNPQVDYWTAEMAENEAKHLAQDQIILFPITGESYSIGSLAEVGFFILNAINLEANRDFVLLIEDQLDEKLTDITLCRESIRLRALIKEHLKKLKLDNLYVVHTLEEMYEVSEKLYFSNEMKQSLLQYNVHRTHK